MRYFFCAGTSIAYIKNLYERHDIICPYVLVPYSHVQEEKYLEYLRFLKQQTITKEEE